MTPEIIEAADPFRDREGGLRTPKRIALFSEIARQHLLAS